jgi:cytohesin
MQAVLYLPQSASVARLLLAKGAVITGFSKAKWTPLHEAALRDNTDAAKEALAAGADPNAKDGIRGQAPLHISAGMGSVEIAKLLIVRGADVQARDNYGVTPLHYAAGADSKGVVALLLGGGAKTDPVVPPSISHRGQTPLHFAADANAADCAELLLAKGANANARDAKGKTPLYLAAEKNALAVARVLLDKGADPSIASSVISAPVDTPMAVAKSAGFTEFVKLLEEHGVAK